jgi:hypothetical protein
MALTLFQKQLKYIDLILGRFWQRHFVRCGGPSPRLSDSNSGAIAQRYDLSNGSISVEHGERLATLYSAQKLAKSGFELSYPHLFHDYI